MKTAQASGSAHDATAVTEDHTPASPEARQQYLDAVADQAEAAVTAVQQTIDDLQASLAERKAEAKRARAAANEGRI